MADLHAAADLSAASVERTLLPEVRPWGSYLVLGEPDHTPIAAVKILQVGPNEMLSLQTHRLRRERWVPLTPGLGALIGSREYELQVGCAYEIEIGVPHRLYDRAGSGGSVIETMYGTYDETDIVRLSDIYHR